MFSHSCNGTNIFIWWKMKCIIQFGFASLNGTFHLSPHENICSIALINIHYLQGRSQPHSPGWARLPLSSVLLKGWSIFLIFSSIFSYFLPHFGAPGGQVAHPGRPWLRHWLFVYHFMLIFDTLFQENEAEGYSCAVHSWQCRQLQARSVWA